jgi:PKD repeat protein
VNSSDLGPNLDIYAELRDANGTLLAANNPADQLYASFNYSLTAGTYFLHVRGTGVGDPLTTGYTSYASLGQYYISGTVVDPSGTVAPVATATATPTSGTVPLVVQLNGSTSFDQDGTIVSYAWNFGDGTTGSGATVSHTYSAAGTFTATLTVTDNSGLTDSESVTIQVQNPNTPPVAAATASPATGTAPLIVTFDGRGSTDADGTIASYQWNFGDGTSGSGSVVQHTYQNAGTYTATLTVTDNNGATASTTVPVVAAQNPAKFIRVQAISLVALSASGRNSVQATVTVTDLAGNPVSGVKVAGAFDSILSGNVSGTTGTSGVVVLTSKRVNKSGTTTFKVTNLTKSGVTYSPSQNLISSATISF